MAVAKHLHRISLENPKILKDAVHAWYENKHKGFKDWKNSYPIKQEVDCPQLAKQQRWCNEAEVQATPTFFLNGYRLPNLLQLEDIKYMI